MKRFIDLRNNYIDIFYRFAWWDTISDQFETYNDHMAWNTWRDFVMDYKLEFKNTKYGKDIYDLERYEFLCLSWAFQESKE